MSRLHHLALRTPDVERLVAFYRHWFALAIVRDQRPRSVWLGLGPAAVLMIERAEPQEPSVPAGSLELFALGVSEEERCQLRERLTAVGLLEAETAYTLYFRDPDGRRVGASSYELGVT